MSTDDKITKAIDIAFIVMILIEIVCVIFVQNIVTIGSLFFVSALAIVRKL